MSQSPPSPEVPFAICCLGWVTVSASPLAFLTGISDPPQRGCWSFAHVNPSYMLGDQEVTPLPAGSRSWQDSTVNSLLCPNLAGPMRPCQRSVSAQDLNAQWFANVWTSPPSP